MHKDRGGVWQAAPITFARALAAALTITLGVSGCAPGVRPETTAASPQAATGPDEGTVAAVRPIAPPAAAAAGQAPGAAPEGDILAAMGVPAASGGAAAAEIVVRTDDGQTLSVVQASAAGLTPGARVMVLPGAMPRLLPLAAAAPTAQLQPQGGSAIGGAI